MMKINTATVRRLLSATAQRLRRALASAVESLRAIWAAHERLMDSNDLYRGTVTAAAYAVARQISPQRLVLAVVSAAMTAYDKAMARRGTQGSQTPDRQEDDPDGWSFA
jgi:hypothetical protein